jgi:hypothetical protein
MNCERFHVKKKNDQLVKAKFKLVMKLNNASLVMIQMDRDAQIVRSGSNITSLLNPGRIRHGNTYGKSAANF